jgi:hypothetical protein
MSTVTYPIRVMAKLGVQSIISARVIMHNTFSSVANGLQLDPQLRTLLVPLTRTFLWELVSYLRSIHVVLII